MTGHSAARTSVSGHRCTANRRGAFFGDLPWLALLRVWHAGCLCGLCRLANQGAARGSSGLNKGAATNKSLPVVGIFSALLALSASSAAEERLETQFDADLVDADAIVIASVDSISAVNGESAEVALKPLRVLANRWDAKTALNKVRVQRSVTQSDAGPSLKLPDRPELRPGGAYFPVAWWNRGQAVPRLGRINPSHLGERRFRRMWFRPCLRNHQNQLGLWRSTNLLTGHR